MAKPRVRLFHWNEAEAAEKAARLTKAGFDADCDWRVEPGFVKRLVERKPEALVIDLSRLPSHGREVGIHARRAKATRFVPLVFAGGEPDKVARIRALIPDAVYAEWACIREAIRQALRDAPAAPVVPDPYMQRFSGHPLAMKLGLKPGTVAALLHAPDGFEEFVRAPEGVEFVNRLTPAATLGLLFARSSDELDLLLPRAVKSLASGKLWICWPKAASRRFRSDLTQHSVLAAARAFGLATSKILSIDSDWSGMYFSRRK